MLQRSSRETTRRFIAALEDAPSVEQLCCDDSIVRPLLDSRCYRMVRLSNGVVVLLCSDPDADEAGASVSVRAGSFDDTRLGLAHFHEHMLFLGTEKYPEEDDFEEFLAANGGYSNAYTADEETLFYASVNADALGGCLDRFGQFFEGPLLRAEAVKREVEAVDAEHAMSLLDDSWRLQSVLRTTVEPSHPYARFSTGNIDTLLGDEELDSLHAELKSFNARHYTAENMRVCIVGREPLEVLEQMAATAFGGVMTVGSNNVSTWTLREMARHMRMRRAEARPAPWPASRLGRRVEVVPVRELRELHVVWPLPLHDAFGEERQTPEIVASHLLGHEGHGTLYSLLRDKGYVESLSCGTSARMDDALVFEMRLDLTELGGDRLDEVLRLCWHWIGVVKTASDAELSDRTAELRWLHEMRFNYRERSAAADLAANAAAAMWEFPMQPLAGPGRVGPDLAGHAPLRRLLDILADPGLALVVVVMPFDDATDESWCVEPWHGARYRSRALSVHELEAYRSEVYRQSSDRQLALPALNQFVPQQFNVKPASGRGVYRLLQKGGTTLWRRADYADAADSVLRAPKCSVKALWRWPRSPPGPLRLGLVKILCGVVAAELNHERYDATLAGLHFSYDATRRGVLLSVSGFSDRMPELFELAASALFTAAAEVLSMPAEPPSFFASGKERAASLFELERAELARHCDDCARDEPVSLASTWANRLLDVGAVGPEELAAAVRDDRLCTLGAAAAELASLEAAPLEMYVAGDLDDEDATRLAAVASGRGVTRLAEGSPDVCLELRPGEDIALELRALAPSEPPGFAFVSDPAPDDADDPNSAVKMVWQLWRSGDDAEARAAGWTDAAERDAAGSLLGHLASASAFQRLRTLDQLGYIVDASIEAKHGVTHFYCLVQSPKLSPPDIETKIHAWLFAFRGEIDKLDTHQVAARARGLADAIAQRPGSLADVVSRDWYEIVTKRRRFSHQARRCHTLRHCTTKEHLLKVLDDLILNESARRLIRARVYAPLAAGAVSATNDTVLRSMRDLHAFRGSRATWPPPEYWDEGASKSEPALP